jgi:hypothetical protein
VITLPSTRLVMSTVVGLLMLLFVVAAWGSAPAPTPRGQTTTTGSTTTTTSPVSPY